MTDAENAVNSAHATDKIREADEIKSHADARILAARRRIMVADEKFRAYTAGSRR